MNKSEPQLIMKGIAVISNVRLRFPGFFFFFFEGRRGIYEPSEVMCKIMSTCTFLGRAFLAFTSSSKESVTLKVSDGLANAV